MSEKLGPYHVVDLAPGRRIWLNTLDMSWPAHSIYGLLEVDVTLVRRFIEEHKARAGETLSFTGYLTYCLARAVEEDKSVQSVLIGRRKLVMFDDVDVGLMVEGQIGDKRALMGHVVRAANRKTYLEIHEEIRAVQNTPVPANRGMPNWFRRAMLLPWPLSSLTKAAIGAVMRRDPTMLAAMGGTVGITSIGLFGGGHSGWGLTPTTQSLSLVVGGVAWKPVVVGRQESPPSRVEPREMLSLTVAFNHDVIDGGPATRFTRRLVELIESGYGLEETAATTGTLFSKNGSHDLGEAHFQHGINTD
jgi:pyruvate/2-oxoglutarate dehydrogenase complex dihydrolipoamide acyltransferase (E2) component